MDADTNVGGRDRIIRLGLTVVLSVVSVKSFREGKRLRGLLAGIGALGFGFNATTGYCGCNDALGIDTTEREPTVTEPDVGGQSDPEITSESPAAVDDTDTDHKLSCAACGEPIVPGQSRGPNDDGEIVHDDCE